MKILITTDWYKPVINGVVTSVLNLERELTELGHEVKVLTLSRNHHSYTLGSTTFIGSFAAGFVYPEARARLPLKSRSIRKIIDWKPDIIHSQCEFSTFGFAKGISKLLDIPLVHTYHTVYEDYTHYFCPVKKWGKAAAAAFTRYVAGRCDAIIVPTEKTSELLHGYGVSCSVSVIPTGINIKRFSCDENKIKRSEVGLSDDDFVCVYVGRLAKEKSLDRLITLHSRLNNKKIKLLLVGDGPIRGELEELSAKLGVTDRVLFTGMVPPLDVQMYYKLGDVFVSASTSETQGLTYIEALASGLAAVCRADKCLENVVSNNVNGILYNSPIEYLSAVTRLSENSKLLKRLCANALTSAERFSCKAFAEAVSELYESALESKKAAGLQTKK